MRKGSDSAMLLRDECYIDGQDARASTWCQCDNLLEDLRLSEILPEMLSLEGEDVGEGGYAPERRHL